MSPEQVRGDAIPNPRIDVYGLGVTLYEAFTLRNPFLDSNASITRQNILDGRPQNPRRLNPGLQRDAATVCLTAIASDPEMRYATVAALLQDLERVQHEQPISARPYTWRYRAAKFVRRNKLLVMSMTAIVTLLTVGLVVSMLLWDEAVRARGLADRRADDSAWQAYTSSMSAAYQALRSGTSARKELFDAPERLRGWEWRHLLARHQSSWQELYRGEEDLGRIATDAACDILACRARKFVLIFDTQTGELRHRVAATDAREARFRCVAVSADARLVAFADSYAVGVLDASTGRLVRRLPRHKRRVSGLCFHPSKTHLASVTVGNQVFVHDAATGELIKRLANLPGVGARTIAYSPDGSRLAVGASNGVHVLDAVTGARVKLAIDAEKRIINSVAFSGDDGLLAATSRHGVWRVWDTATWHPVTLPRFENAYCWSHLFLPRSRELLIGTPTLTSNDIRSGRRRTLWMTRSSIQDMVAHPRLPLAYVTRVDNTMGVIGTDSSTMTKFRVRSHYVGEIAVHPSGRNFVVPWGWLTLHDLVSGKELYSAGGGYKG